MVNSRFLLTLTFLLLPTLCVADVPGAVSVAAPYLVRIETIGGHEKVGREFVNEGTSTGILLDQEGHVLTGAFNFLHDPTSILLIFPDGTKKVAKKIATDQLRMLTLLKANDFTRSEPIQLPMRSKASIKVGERCVAVGLALAPTEPNIALGIISGKDRIWGKAIQTDAAIGPNNYGGLLVDLEGKVLGVPVPISMMSDDVTAGAETYDAGVGLAIPWEDAMTLLPKLKEGNDLFPGSVGFGFKDNQTFVGAPVLAVVAEDSPAGKAGLKVGDKIVRIDNVPMHTALDVTKNVRLRYANETLKITFQREGAEQTVSLTTIKREKEKDDKQPPEDDSGEEEPATVSPNP
jgi:serine protease Do